MNRKLVNRNPVLKFKVEKKQLGGLFNRIKQVVKSPVTLGIVTVHNPLAGAALYAGKLIYQNGLYNTIKSAAKSPVTLGIVTVYNPLAGAVLWGGKTLFLNKTPQALSNNTTLTPSTLTKKPLVNNIWLNGYKHNEISDVRATQKMLLEAGYDIGNTGIDGKWGKNTERAYNQYLAAKLVEDFYNKNNNINDENSQPIIKSTPTKWTPQGGDWKSNLQKTLNLTYYKKGGQLVSKNSINRFKTFFRMEAVS